MGVFDKQIQRVRKIPEEVEKAIRKAITDNEAELLNYIKIDQLKKEGEDGEGNRLGDYSNKYKRLRIKAGLQVAHIDLSFTSRMFKSMKIVTTEKNYKVVINVPYDKKLVERFGRDFLKVQRKNLEKFSNDRILPEIKKAINDQLTKP